MSLLLQILGIAVLIQGGGSAIASFYGGTWNFTMAWAYGYQPYAGIVIALIGGAMAYAGSKMEKAPSE